MDVRQAELLLATMQATVPPMETDLKELVQSIGRVGSQYREGEEWSPVASNCYPEEISLMRATTPGRISSANCAFISVFKAALDAGRIITISAFQLVMRSSSGNRQTPKPRGVEEGNGSC